MDTSLLLERSVWHGGITLVCSIIVLLFCFIDLWDGVRTARCIGEKIRSHKLRKTFEKFLFYWAILICCTLIDALGLLFTWYAVPYITIVVTVIIGIIELLSLCEHARKRKDNASKIEEVLKQIVEASTKKEAKDVLSRLTEIVNTLNSK